MHLLQACARAYGEREVLGACVRAMNQVTLPPRSARLLEASSRDAQMPPHITPSASTCKRCKRMLTTDRHAKAPVVMPACCCKPPACQVC